MNDDEKITKIKGIFQKAVEDSQAIHGGELLIHADRKIGEYLMEYE